jgi:hypothetical protein
MSEMAVTSDFPALVQEAQDTQRQLAKLAKKGVKFPYESNDLARSINRLISIYSTQLADAERVAYLMDEGVFEVTLRTRTGTLTLPVEPQMGIEAAALVQKVIQDQLDFTVERIATARKEYAKEMGDDFLEKGYAQRLVYQQLLTKPVPHFEPSRPAKLKNAVHPTQPGRHRRRR